jgi:2-hydroxychromene-2-carboxylate isomerase
VTCELFYDLGSPYGYLAVARAPAVLGGDPELVPVLLGAIFAERGHGSWSQTDSRAENVTEVERRAREYGLPAGELRDAVARQDVKDELRRVTAEAWAAGVIGVPCVRVGPRIFYGDDRLEDAAAALREAGG